jgi:hypothetical protein
MGSLREGGWPRELSWLAGCVPASLIYERVRRETWVHLFFGYQTICNQLNVSLKLLVLSFSLVCSSLSLLSLSLAFPQRVLTFLGIGIHFRSLENAIRRAIRMWAGGREIRKYKPSRMGLYIGVPSA